MGHARIHLRYQVTQSIRFGGMWSVIDIFTGQPVNYHGVFLDALMAEEVDDLVDLLNGQDLKARGQLHSDL